MPEEVLVHKEKWKVVALSDLRIHPKNPNKHTPAQIHRLAQLIQYQGVRWPIIVSNLSKCIVAGEGRYLSAKLLGMKNFPVVYQEFDSPEQEYAFMVSDNAISEWSTLDRAQINQDMIELGPEVELEALAMPDFELDPADRDEVHEDQTAPKGKKDKEVRCPSCGVIFRQSEGKI